jgi:nitrogenase molybdenum-iron protein alpha chain
LKEHTEIQYTNWWIEQSDPYILAKNPKLLDEKFNELLEARRAADI